MITTPSRQAQYSSMAPPLEKHVGTQKPLYSANERVSFDVFG
jgi:hypothetical protein